MNLADVALNKAQYNPGDNIQIKVILSGEDKEDNYILNCQINDLDRRVKEYDFVFTGNSSSDVVEFNWHIPEDCYFASFGVDLFLSKRRGLIDRISTGFDVTEHWSQAPRYGFLATFGPDKEADLIKKRIANMNNLHLNIVQFYDWMYRHHQLLTDNEEYQDIFDRPLSKKAICSQIKECWSFGIIPIAYGAIYGAEDEFVQKHKDWIAATRNQTGRNSLLDEYKEYIQIMNISFDCPWRDHIVEEFRKALIELGFGGIHLDQYGYPKTYFSIIDGKQELKDMGREFANFIEYTREKLGVETALVFNAVNNWPIEFVADKPQDVIYIEVWPPNDTFYHLRELILRARELSSYSKQVILAAYISSLNYRNDCSTEAAERSARLTTAAIFANGGFQLLIGEGSRVLTSAYYPEFVELNPAFTKVIEDYYHTITRYSKYLFALDLKDTSAYISGGINNELTIKRGGEDLRIGPNAEKDSIWTIVRENRRFKLLNLVNLMGIETIKWDEPQPRETESMEELNINWMIDEDIDDIYWVSPDGGDIRAVKLPYARTKQRRGETVEFQLPQLDYWGFVIVKIR